MCHTGPTRKWCTQCGKMFDTDHQHKTLCEEARQNDGQCACPDAHRDTWKDHYTDHCPDCKPGNGYGNQYGYGDEKPGCCIIL